MIQTVSLIVVLMIAGQRSFAQASGDFRSTASGQWGTSTTWQRYNGTTWEASGVGANNPGQTPSSTSAVWIQTGHVVTLAANGSCSDLHIATGTTAASTTLLGKVGLATFTLNVNGKLRCYFATLNTIPGTTSSNGYSIYPFTGTTGKVSIVGATRTVLNTGEWGATVTDATTGIFPLEVNLNDNSQTATFQTNIKTSTFNLAVGIVDGASISMDNGTTGQGDATIATGTTLISSVTSNNVFQRTGSTRAGTLTLNGTLRFTGATPQISMNAISFNGTVEYSRSGAQTFVAATNSGAAPTTYTNISLLGTSAKTTIASATITINGTLSIQGTTSLALGSSSLVTYFSFFTTLEYKGSALQTATAVEWPASGGPQNVIVNNSNNFRLPITRTLTGDFKVLAGDVQNLSGTAVTLTMTGAAASLQVDGSITGTNVGSGNDINLGYSNLTGTLTVSGTGSLCRFLNATVFQTGSTMALSRGFEVMFGAFTVNGKLQIKGGGFVSSAVNAVVPTYAVSTSTLEYNTTSYTTTNAEFPPSGVKNVNIIAPSGTNTVTLNSDKTITGTFAIGTHTVDGGKSIDAASITIGTGSLVAGTLTTSSSLTCSGASSISLTGSWNVTGFTRSTSTVTFTGSGNLNANSIFNNLTNSGGTRSITSDFSVARTLLVSGGDMRVSGGSGKTMTMSGATSTINITSGSITGTDATAGNDLTLLISGAQTTLTGNATSNDDHEKKFFNVTVNNGSTLVLSRGILCRYGSFSVAGAIQINANGYIQTNPSSSVVPSYNASTGSLTYNNGGPFTTAGEWPGTNSPTNVSLIAAGTNVTLTGNRNVSGIVTLTDGTITTSSNTLAVSNSATAAVVRTNGYVIGNLQRAVATGTNTYAYAVGTASGYTPASIAFSGTTGAGSVTVVSLNGASSNYPAALSATKRVARYWTVTNSGVSGFTADATFTYLGADLVGGATQSSVKPYKFDAPSTFSYPSSSTGTLSFTESGITSFSEFGAGECGTVTVNPITGGGASLCIGATQQLASTTPSGVWSSDAAGIASVSGTGLVTGVAAGTTTIHYTVTDISGCTGEATQSVTVLPNYTITASAGSGGAISPNGVTTLCEGANQTYTITAADACHVISDVVVDGVSQGAVGTYTFTNVTANHTISATFSLNTYTITVTAGANGSITPATGSINCGDNATYTITANACYSIADVVVDGVSQGAVGTFTFTNVTANHTISATFSLNTYTITVTAGANGSITPATGSVNCGDNATYTITANACYSIADVVVDGVSQGAVGTFTFTNVTANHTISATFSLNTYTITVTAGANGSITPATGSVNCGDNATYTITPNACYSIADVVVDGVSQGAVGTYTFTNVTAAHTISATFVLNTYTITVTAGANGSITPATGSVNCGDNATYTITANACYSIADVVVDGVSQGAVGTFTFTNVTANHTISATFALTTYTITATAGANGSITPATGSVNCGDNATYTITANACYSIADVVVDGVSQGAVGTFTFTNVTANHTISATFSLNTYTITVTAGANGSITPATGSVNCGDNATYTITADACYSIADVVVDGVSQGAVGTFTFTNVTANHTISATFSLNTYTITVTAGANGSITPATGSVNCGDNATYTITADACYSIAGVVVDGVSQGAVGTYTFTNVTAAHTISATFVLNTYTITVTAGANGSITPATGSVNCGDNATYTITADACYSIADVVVDGVSQGAVGTYTFTNVTANHTISATFSLNTYTITVTAGANGSITPATGSVNCGDNATYTITPDACYVINEVVVDGVSAGTVGTYTFTNVTANHTISATFVLATYTITVTNGANGSINPQSIVKACGSNQTFTMIPDDCYSVQDVIVDGVSQGAVGTYTFTNITAPHSISATFVLNTYTITVTAGANGSITPATGSVNCGDNATYTITPNACYSIADVVVDGVSQGAVGTYTFTNVTANHTISATFVLNTYTITVTAGANGSITPGTGSVNCGDNATYTITADACYSIADVVVDGVSQGAVGTYTFTNVTANHTISATFSLNTYTITVTAGANGSITPATGSVNCGDNATYTITADACYSIADVVVDGVSQGAVGTYTFTNVTANHTISATFSLNTYTITVTAGANGSITPATGSVNCGDNATYTITADACYSIADVVVDGISQGAVGTYTFTNVTANHTISATFALNTYTITVTAGANGSITPGTGSVNCGDNATYTITADACYSIADVVVDGVSQGAVGTYTFTNVTANHTISATFSLNTYTITVTAGANGSITPATGSVNCGDNATYTITADACYSIADVVVDGVSQGAVGTYTFTNVTANHTISATFSLNTYTITVTAGANGSITPATGSVNCGDNATYTITADACYSIADVVVDGVSQGAVGTYTFTNVTANHTISATFSLNTYTITVTAGANGSITPATGSVNCGDNATYTITADACYSIADVVVDGVSQGAVGTYTFTNVTANHTISATFVATTYTITVTAGANGSIAPATGSVNCGDNATYTITADACYSIADVVVDGVSQGAVGTYTFTNVTANHTISATFSLNTYTITVTAGANGSITPATGSVNCGDNATYTITAAPCYTIADVIVDGVSQGAVGTYTFTNVTANHTISASFVIITYNITSTAGAGGSISPLGVTAVNCGGSQAYSIAADPGFVIDNVFVDGISQGPISSFTFNAVGTAHSIDAFFIANTYTITSSAGAGGTISPNGATVLNSGDNQTYTITANTCFSIADVVVDGVSQGAVGTYTFTNVTANHTISATFVATTYTITVTAGANGSITPGTGSVNCGSNATYNISPIACYHVANVIVDGVSQGAITTYTFTNVTANHTISATFAINTPLAAPVVTGPTNVCPYIGTGDPVTYTATSAGATGFTWVIPPTNVTIISGQGTANLTVTFQNGFAAQANKQLRVTATSACGNSQLTIYYLLVQIPSTPQPIVGNTNVCPIIGTPNTYSYTIPSVPGATSYVWNAQPVNAVITHPNGPGVNDTTVNVSFTNSFTSSSITVAAANGCGTSSARSLALIKTNPSQPGLISGPTNACAYMAPGGTPASYSIVPVSGATSYTWTVPAGAIGLTGQGTTSISFTYPNGFVSGTVSVTATNGCGTSVARNLSISKLNPSTPSVIDVIQVAPCPDRIYTYTLSAMPANATSVQWTVPAGGTITNGQGTSSITVSYTAASVNGNVTAQAFNNCGSSTIRISAVKLGSCQGERAITTKGTTVPATTASVENMLVNVFPNPTVSDFKLQVVTAGKQTINVRIMDAQGRNIKTFVVMPYQTTNVGADLKAGAYIMEVRQGNEVKLTKLLKF